MMIKTDNLLINVDYGLTNGRVIHNCSILCRDKSIYAIGGASSFKEAVYTHCLDLKDCYAVPGFVDGHIYGFGKISLLDSMDVNALSVMARELPAHGVTSFLATLQSTNRPKLIEALKRTSDNILNQEDGAEALGIHLIGPFINPELNGLVRDEGVRKYSRDELEEIIEAAQGTLKVMTLAPEVEGAQEIIEILTKNGIQASMGHSSANEHQVHASMKAGARNVTHLYNCMKPLHQREMGLSSTALVDESLTCELIFDGFHIHPQMLDLACRAKGGDKISAVSSANQGTGLPDGRYKFDENEYIIEDQHLLLPDGTIAGSMLTLEQAWQNVINFTHMNTKEAIACFTSTPSTSLGLSDRGHLSPGLKADIAIFNKDHELQATLINGNIAYIKNEENLRQIND
ncbi:N-acetylglucosamine-6-phosphate deacetylase [Lentisphaera profundi]|uniref:N-acetylglucosamine-6-phosphate deacetylase n=1 Tax=Lentisphaera profundi TaxID=1658616 RepID=A0ABY7W458_9BACT|nr:N-acetylglucosamine-6-phosphate deacetylase [Lentisphaera profundi]WDE99028.1 N-acetylglucosamine-6-phosphate deacetylase [Lentisphaera profundi]